MQILVDAVDVNGQPMPLIAVRAVYEPTGAAAPDVTFSVVAGWAIDCDGSTQLAVTVVPPSSTASNVSVSVQPSSDPSAWAWDNPAVNVQGGLLGPSRITVTVGRAVEAPFDQTGESSLLAATRNQQTGAITGATITGVLGDPDPSRIGGSLIRHLVVRPESSFQVAGSSLIGNASATGAARFNFLKRAADPLGGGRFVLVEYGDRDARAFADRRRYLVAVWAPTPLNRPLVRPAKLDVVVHYTPSTFKAPYTAVTYPYGALAVVTEHAAIVEQPYIALAIRHLFLYHQLAYALIAAGRRAAIVMPISPSGVWGPFGVGAGLWRFLVELPVILASTGYSARAFKAHKPPATIGNVAVTGFSEGGSVAASLLTRSSVFSDPRGTAFNWTTARPALWSAPGADQAFSDHFCEFWDIDSSFQGLPEKTFQTRRGDMARWLAAAANRQLRIYHTATTAGAWKPDIAAEPDPDFRALLKSVQTTPPSVRQQSTTTGDWAQQWDDSGSPSRWTVVKLSDSGDSEFSNSGYIGGPNGLGLHNSKGQFFAGHELMPQVAFGHAAGLSQLASP
jgi:hypothetical protein